MPDTDRSPRDASPASVEMRRRMAIHRAARRHSVLVRLLRRGIPPLAVLGMATVGLAVLHPSLEVAGVTAGVRSLGIEGSRVVMQSPRLSGFRKDASRYEITAARGIQDVRKPSLMDLEGIDAVLLGGPGGSRISLGAPSGTFDSKAETLTLAGTIRVETQDGDVAILRSASANVRAGTLASSDPVSLSGPRGTIDADSIEVSGPHVASFVGNVHAVFPGDPGQSARRMEASASEGPE